MPNIDGLHDDSTVREVVEATLGDVMPEETSDGEIADLVESVMSDPLVLPHQCKLWLDLSSGEESILVQVTGRVAAYAILMMSVNVSPAAMRQ